MLEEVQFFQLAEPVFIIRLALLKVRDRRGLLVAVGRHSVSALKIVLRLESVELVMATLAKHIWSLGRVDAVSIVEVVLRSVAKMTLLVISELLVSLTIETDVEASRLASMSMISMSMISRCGKGIKFLFGVTLPETGLILTTEKSVTERGILLAKARFLVVLRILAVVRIQGDTTALAMIDTEAGIKAMTMIVAVARIKAMTMTVAVAWVEAVIMLVTEAWVEAMTVIIAVAWVEAVTMIVAVARIKAMTIIVAEASMLVINRWLSITSVLAELRRWAVSKWRLIRSRLAIALLNGRMLKAGNSAAYVTWLAGRSILIVQRGVCRWSLVLFIFTFQGFDVVLSPSSSCGGS